MAKKSVKQKVQKELPEFASEVDALSPEALRDRIVELSRAVEQIKEDIDQNPGIQDAKEALSQILGPYRDAAKIVKLKIKYLLEVSE